MDEQAALQILQSPIYSAWKTSGFNEMNLFTTASNKQSHWLYLALWR